MRDRKQYMKEYNERRKESQREYQQEYGKKNRKKIEERKKNRRRNDPAHRMRCNLKNRIYHAVKNQGIVKGSSTMDLTGCSAEELMSHLESQFTEGMTRDNYGKWHVDHIKPCASFNLLLDTEQKACFHYSNLQPLWAEDNLVKGDRYQ
tara:strand:- start:39 stop:485 length:447 start_codon:yes stop_codon:yes gene_type:complete